MQCFYLREYGYIRVGQPAQISLDEIQLKQADVDYLHLLNQKKLSHTQHQKAIFKGDQRGLYSQNMLGVIVLPSGICLELLPKLESESVAALKQALWQMIRHTQGLKGRQIGVGYFKRQGSVLEALYSEFLVQVQQAFPHGLRQAYQTQAQQQPVLRGKLDVAAYIRQGEAKQHLFPIRTDVLGAQQWPYPLLQAALQQVMRHTQQLALKQRCHIYLTQQPVSALPKQWHSLKWPKTQFWQQHRHLYDYCMAILQQQQGLSAAGQQLGISYLFASEQLFERYAAHALQQQLQLGLELHAQHQARYLGAYQQRPVLKLRPDFVISTPRKVQLVCDAKWKQLDYFQFQPNLARSDVYQMYAYSQAYQCDTVLIYPSLDTVATWSAIELQNQAKLWVLPLDLNTGQIQLDLEQHQALWAWLKST